MARPTLWNHRKFRELTMALKSKAMAIGTLECLWRGPYDSGDPLIGSQEAVEHAIYWRGKKGDGAALLLKCGFLDLTPRGYEVHDLLDHAPQYVRTRLQREQKRRQRSITDQSLMRQRSITDEHSRSEHCALSTEHCARAPLTPPATATGFEDFWNHYPKKSGREAALRAWLSVVTNGEAPVIMAALSWQVDSSEWKRESGRFIPKAENYLFEKRWTDEKPAGTYVAPEGEPF